MIGQSHGFLVDVAPPLAGGLPGGHGDANLLLGVARALCRTPAPFVWHLEVRETVL